MTMETMSASVVHLAIKTQLNGDDISSKFKIAKQALRQRTLLNSAEQVQDLLLLVKSLPEPQLLFHAVDEEEFIDSDPESEHGDEKRMQDEFDPTFEFYHCSSKDPKDDLLQFTLLKAWEAGRLKRWREWHDAQISVLLNEEAKMARRRTFMDKLKGVHPWMNGESEMTEQARRLRVHSDSVVNAFKQQPSLEDPMDEDEKSKEELLQERKSALTKLAQAREQRKNKQENLLLPIAVTVDDPMEIVAPLFAQQDMSPSQYLLQKRHRVCVSMYEVLVKVNKKEHEMPLKTYKRLLNKYDALLNAFPM